MIKKQVTFSANQATANTSIWKEALFAADLLLLHTSPVYYGFGVPHGDRSGVVLLPGFLGSDIYLAELHGWLCSIGYRASFSGIRVNAECPNLLIRDRVNKAVDRARKKTGKKKVHLIGHSLGGIIARAVAAQRPQDIASVITLASPFRGTVAHGAILKAAEMVRQDILRHTSEEVLPQCYTGRCSCDFLNALKCTLPDDLMETAIFTRNDGVVDWRYCRTYRKSQDFEVSGTHIGLAFNPSVYSIIAERLALADQQDASDCNAAEQLRCA